MLGGGVEGVVHRCHPNGLQVLHVHIAAHVVNGDDHDQLNIRLDGSLLDEETLTVLRSVDGDLDTI